MFSVTSRDGATDKEEVFLFIEILVERMYRRQRSGAAEPLL